MECFNYSEISDRQLNNMAEFIGYQNFDDYKNKKGDNVYDFIKDYNSYIKKNVSLTFETPLLDEFKDGFNSKFNLEKWLKHQNPFDAMSMTRVFKNAFCDRSVWDAVSDSDNGEKAFKELIKRGVNKEQIRIMLFKEEKELLEKMLSEEKKPLQEKNQLVIIDYKEKLSNVVSYQTKLERIKSPYDNLFEVSQEISELKNEYNKISGKSDLTKDDILRQDRIEMEIEQKENWLAKEMTKYDPRIVSDVINDKIERVIMELEIESIKKGKEQSQNDILEPREITELKAELRALKKQVQKDLKYIEQKQIVNI